MNRAIRREKNRRWFSDFQGTIWAYRNWVKNGFRKASEIPLTSLRLNTLRGEVMCFNDPSPWRVRKLQGIASMLYRLSNEEIPLFVTLKNFRRIEEIEHG